MGGVSPQVTEDIFDKFFRSFGPVVECRLVIDKFTRSLFWPDQSRGFGFVSYVNNSDAQKVLNKTLYLCDKEIECKDALSKSDSNAKVIEEKNKKVFVGGLPHDITHGRES